jgi:hypothetical protein
VRPETCCNKKPTMYKINKFTEWGCGTAPTQRRPWLILAGPVIGAEAVQNVTHQEKARP